MGFAEAGLKPVLAADIDPDACKTYQANLGVDAFEVDVSDNHSAFRSAVSAYKGALALIGGPPCQGFSSAGRKDGRDKRNKLIFEYLSIVESVSPRWFLFENVEGLLTSNDGDSVCSLIREFVRLGYRVRLEKMNFAAYGLPQARKRVLLMGNRLGLEFSFPAATHSFDAGKHKHINGKPSSPSLGAALAGLGKATEKASQLASYSAAEPVTAYDAMMRAGNRSGQVSLHFVSVSPQQADLISRLRPGETMKDLPSEFWHASYKRRAFRRVMDGTPTERRGGAPSGVKRLSGDLNSLTITSAASREFIHPREDRPLTIRECARLQSLPDKFSFVGNPMSAIRQIGNAFPPLAARVLAEHISVIDGRFGSDVSWRDQLGRLIGYRLTESAGMSPALARTNAILKSLLADQPALPFEQTMAEVA